MAKDDIVRRMDLAMALGLLTRLPVSVDLAQATERGGRAAWAWPVAGAVVGAGGALGGSLALWVGLPPGLAAGLVLTTQVLLTGALHEDGLADSADGLWGGADRARRLEIMKDSRIGTYGVLALVLALGLRWQALGLLIGQGLLWPAIIAVAVLSRLPMVVLAHLLPFARKGGLGFAVGRPPRPAVWLATALACGATLALVGIWTLPLVLVTCGISLVWAAIAMAKIGGQTGDILGASQQLADCAGLLTLVALAA